VADGVKIRRKIQAKMPGFELDKPVLTEIFEIAEGSILDNILSQKQASGGALKRNAPGTRKRKQKQGNRLPGHSLIDRQHRFIKGRRQSYQHSIRGRGSNATIVIYPATQELRTLNRYVQRKGYTGWFGVSKEAFGLIRFVVRKWVNREVKKAVKLAKTARGQR
jgi:hypothetical protein